MPRHKFSLLLSVLFLAGITPLFGLSQQAGSPAKKESQKEPWPPAESQKKFICPGDLEVETVLAEPTIAQPVFLNFDERGRMWVVEYRQYPRPAGLKVVSRDKYWRVVYDKVPPPPPHHFPGKDRITLHEDTDGDGIFDKHTTFVEGLNIASAVTKGRGGVWVLNPPYLLFYPDKNNDDIPDGDPVVHLEGFGLEDTHSVVNSLRWGPDGWLYATQGSTVSGQVKRPGLDKNPVSSMGQLVWRYHPETRRYEIFAEGGGNAFGVEFDRKGRTYSGHNDGNTRGFYYVQGGYYLKGFAKHGDLSNPYAFGYFPAMRHNKAPRFTHIFVLYEDLALPEAYHNRLFALNSLQGQVIRCEIQPDGSSFQTKDLDLLLSSTDSWFRPVDMKVGPDGALYLADFYEERIDHLHHNDGQIHADSGRIHRLKTRGAKAVKAPNLGDYASADLVKLLGTDNRWMKQTALRLLGDRKDQSVIGMLIKMIREGSGQQALESLWALNLSGGLDDKMALETLQHQDPHVRLWTVRLLGDQGHMAAEISDRLAELASKETNIEVRSQLACSARRLPARDTMRIIRPLLEHGEDVKDVHLPLLLWWAIEAKADNDRDVILKIFEDPALWRLPMVEKHILGRLMRRYAQTGKQKDLLTCARFLRMAPGAEQAKLLLAGFEQAYSGRAVANLPHDLVKAMASRGGGSLSLRLRQHQPAALKEALAALEQNKGDLKTRLQLVQILGEINEPSSVAVLLHVLGQSKEGQLQEAALGALQSYNDPRVPVKILDSFSSFSADLKVSGLTLLVTRSPWSLQLLQAVDANKLEKISFSPELVRKILLHRDEKIQTLVRKHWGEVKGATTADMGKEIDRLVGVMKIGKGDPYVGRKLFLDTCGKCHVMFGKGGDVGPDLTAYKRDDVEMMLLHVINPSAEIREGFETHHILTDDGRALLGFITEKDNQIVALRDAEGRTTVIPRERIEDMRIVPQSIMPEGLLKDWPHQKVRDLFAYLRSSQPLNVKD